MSMREPIEKLLEAADISGIVTHYLLVVAIADTDGNERIINLMSDGSGMMNHLGLVQAAKLTAEQRYYASDEDDDEGEEDDPA